MTIENDKALMELGKLKIRRASLRTVVTKTITKVENLFKNSDFNSDVIQELSECLAILNDKHTALKELDKEIDAYTTDINE